MILVFFAYGFPPPTYLPARTYPLNPLHPSPLSPRPASLHPHLPLPPAPLPCPLPSLVPSPFRERKFSPKFFCINFFHLPQGEHPNLAMSRPKSRDIPATPLLKLQKRAPCTSFCSGYPKARARDPDGWVLMFQEYPAQKFCLWVVFFFPTVPHPLPFFLMVINSFRWAISCTGFWLVTLHCFMAIFCFQPCFLFPSCSLFSCSKACSRNMFLHPWWRGVCCSFLQNQYSDRNAHRDCQPTKLVGLFVIHVLSQVSVCPKFLCTCDEVGVSSFKICISHPNVCFFFPHRFLRCLVSNASFKHLCALSSFQQFSPFSLILLRKTRFPVRPFGLDFRKRGEI